MILTVNTVYHRVRPLGKCTRCTHQDLGVPEAPGRRCGPCTRESQMIRRTQWDPLGDLFEDPLGAQAELDQMSQPLAHALGRHGQPRGAEGDAPAWMPALDISERKDAYLITVELPGVELDDVQITMEGNLLAIQGERVFAHESSEQRFHRIERRYGAFRRLITLPDHVMVDAVQATAGGGVLQILVPKAEEAKPKRIQVRPVDEQEPTASSPAAH